MKKFNPKDILPGTETTLYLEVAHLPTRTRIDIPMFVYRGVEEGPSLLLSAGMHGDEINGVEIVREILDNNHHHVQRGTVVCVPIINVFGFLFYSRYVPDGKDVNRSFPGHSSGSLASKVAHTVMNEIIPYIDYGIDFHTGGDQRENYPQTRCDFSDTKAKELVDAFKAPFTIHSEMIPKSLRASAYEKGKSIVVYEAGESVRFNRFAIEEGINGALRVMHHLKMIDNAPEPNHKSHVLKRKSWLRCENSGMWISEINLNDFVKKGQRLGYITSPYGDFKVEVKADEMGYVIGLNNQPVVNKGDALVHIGS